MIDIKKITEEAEAELVAERGEKAKRQIKSKLNEIASAEKILANLRREYATLLEDIGETV
jgi:hypothetical protein